MNRPELLEAVVKQTALPHAHVNKVYEAFTAIIQNQLKKGNQVQLTGFTTWMVAKRKARLGRNPKTGESLKIPARRVVRAKAGSKLIAAVRG